MRKQTNSSYCYHSREANNKLFRMLPKLAILLSCTILTHETPTYSDFLFFKSRNLFDVQEFRQINGRASMGDGKCGIGVSIRTGMHQIKTVADYMDILIFESWAGTSRVVACDTMTFRRREHVKYVPTAVSAMQTIKYHNITTNESNIQNRILLNRGLYKTNLVRNNWV